MQNISKFLTLAGFVLLFSQVSFSQTKWNPDYSHSSIKFTATHLLISEVEGNFRTFNGSMEA